MANGTLFLYIFIFPKKEQDLCCQKKFNFQFLILFFFFFSLIEFYTIYYFIIINISVFLYEVKYNALHKLFLVVKIYLEWHMSQIIIIKKIIKQMTAQLNKTKRKQCII